MGYAIAIIVVILLLIFIIKWIISHWFIILTISSTLALLFYSPKFIAWTNSDSNAKSKNKIPPVIMASISFVLIFGIVSTCFGGFRGNDDSISGVDYSENSDGATYTITKSYELYPDKLPTVLNIPEDYNGKKVTAISNFGCCHEIKIVNGSKNIKTISADAFGCRCVGTLYAGKMELREIIFPEDASLESIGSEAFFNFYRLEKIVLPKSIKSLGSGVFYGCCNLQEIYIHNPIPPAASSFFSVGSVWPSPPEHIKVYVPHESVEAYKNSVWGGFDILPLP